MSLFIRHPPKTASKRGKRKINGKLGSKKVETSKQKLAKDEVISSDSDLSDIDEKNKLDFVSDEEETVQEKRLRIAKKYLEEIEKEEAAKADKDDIDEDIVSHRLRKDVLKQAGRLQEKIADKYDFTESEIIHIMKGHKLPVTCLAVTSNQKYIFSGSKDCSIIKWCLQTGKRLKTIHGGRKGTEEQHVGHTDHVLCLAVSSDSKYLASGGRNNLIHIWNVETMEKLHTFKGHKDAISGLVFQKGTHQLISTSFDRSVKLWNLDEMTYIETLFGHQDVITGVDATMQERALTSGGRDNTLRIWKIVEESQLVFQGDGSSIERCCLINDQHFLSGSDNGSIAVWGIQKKKPLNVISKAHGVNEINGEPNWITSLTALQNTDIAASGSQDGKLRLWKWEDKVLTPLHEIPLVGFINDIKFMPSGDYLVAGIGQEHRLGRWWRLKNAKNVVVVIKLKRL
ncbi:U3 small nucleolar RNA-interacting protein 2-like [Centruroides sculpturatus]|uniref:U3 small nucleolar RNA-interacting protein 2-like n=1 Tax=Centruroides sculpturatus TaxID=218467 RepID=UPI000C6EE136|nr:U3 small nucleolar RNA-interacting protein 2-like [Centruroides sculpturatus]